MIRRSGIGVPFFSHTEDFFYVYVPLLFLFRKNSLQHFR